MEEKSILKKWYFWVIVVLLIIIGVLCYFVFANNSDNDNNSNKNKNIKSVSQDIQSIDSEATLYSSADNSTVVVEIPNYKDDTKKIKKEKIENIIKKHSSSGGTLSNYSKLIIITKINSDNKKDYFYNTEIYTLPNMIENEDEGKVYIDFLEMTKESLGNSTTSSNNNSNTTTTKGEDIILTAGKYIVGEDIKAGKYDAVAQSGSGNVYVKGSTSVIESMGTTDDTYYLRNYNNITLKNGDTVEITSKLKLKLQAK